MARHRDRLNALTVSRLKAPGMYPDGGGLYLQIKARQSELEAQPAPPSKSWVFRYRMGGRKTPRDIGLGPAIDVTLAEARQRAAEQRKLNRLVRVRFPAATTAFRLLAARARRLELSPVVRHR